MIFRRTVRFKHEFKELPAEIQKMARAKFALFSANWTETLRLHQPRSLSELNDGVARGQR